MTPMSRSRSAASRRSSNSHGVWRLSNTSVGREPVFRCAYGPDHLRGLITPLAITRCAALPAPKDGSVSEVLPSEVSPFADRSLSPGPCPPAVKADSHHAACTTRPRRLPTSGLCSRRRSVGAVAPRSSHGIHPFRVFNPRTRRPVFRPDGPPLRFSTVLHEGGRWRHSGVCSARVSAFLSRGSVPSRGFEPCVLPDLLESGASRDHGFSSAVPTLRRTWSGV